MKGDIAHLPLLVSENYSHYTFMRYQNVGSIVFLFVTEHACDKQTDRQTELRSQDRVSIAASHGKNAENSIIISLVGVGSRDLLLNFGTPLISQKKLKQETSNFVGI